MLIQILYLQQALSQLGSIVYFKIDNPAILPPTCKPLQLLHLFFSYLYICLPYIYKAINRIFSFSTIA
jgi:hypothetical protein